MVLWVPETWGKALRSAAGQHKHVNKVNTLHSARERCEGHPLESARIDRETLFPGFWGRVLVGFGRVEDQAGMRFGWSKDLFQSKEKSMLGLPTNTAGGFDASGFLKEDTIRDNSFLLGFAGLALLSATVSYAEDENARLQEQPEAKSNIHTAKWRIFTDKARDLCSQGSFDNAEKYFYKALEEAKLGFGEEDPHVASCYNNLAELFRMKKEYDKAEPLYLEAVKRLREASGAEDGSIGFALHNLGGFYLLQRKVEQAQRCYEEALKIKGRALGLDHPEYANTMFHLGEVIRIRGDIQDGLALVRDSIRILEQVGLGNTTLAVRRLTRFSETLVMAGQLEEAERVQRKILQVIEFSKDFSFSDTVAALENLSVILQKQGKLDECLAILKQSIEIVKDNKGGDDSKMVPLLLKSGGVRLQQGKSFVAQKDSLQALASYDKAEGLLCEAIRIGELHVDPKQKRSAQGDTSRHALLLARCLAVLGDVHFQKFDVLVDSQSSWKVCKDAERVLRRAVSLLEEIFMQGENSSPEVYKVYRECSRHLDELMRKLSDIEGQGNA